MRVHIGKVVASDHRAEADVATEDKEGNSGAELTNTDMKYVSICLKIQLPATVTAVI